MSWEVRQGDCIEAMAEMEEASVDAVVCDPPYGLEFMGRTWDRLWDKRGDAEEQKAEGYVGSDGVERSKTTAFSQHTSRPTFIAGAAAQEWHHAWATEALRVLKPGGHLLAFGGTRTYHRLACAIEDAGFEIRDSLLWLYGSGFPKSLAVDKAIDRQRDDSKARGDVTECSVSRS
jgi:site-specific DNA-methyltransferase (adenine-specific)